MKRTIPLIILLTFFACTVKEKPLVVKSLNAYSVISDTSRNLNVSCVVYGFKSNEFRGGYFSKISFVIDIVNPDGKIDTAVQKGVVDQVALKGVMDSPVKTSIKLADKYKAGSYSVILNIKDEHTGRKLKSQKAFELKN